MGSYHDVHALTRGRMLVSIQTAGAILHRCIGIYCACPNNGFVRVDDVELLHCDEVKVGAGCLAGC